MSGESRLALVRPARRRGRTRRSGSRRRSPRGWGRRRRGRPRTRRRRSSRGSPARDAVALQRAAPHRYCCQWVAHGRLSWVSGSVGTSSLVIATAASSGALRTPSVGGASTTARGRAGREDGPVTTDLLDPPPPGRFALTGYAAVQLAAGDRRSLVLFVLLGRRRRADRGVGRAAADPRRWRPGHPVARQPAPADGRARDSAGRCRRRTRRCRPRGSSPKLRTVRHRPDDLARPGLDRWWRSTVGFMISLTVVILLLGDRHLVHLVVRDAAADAGCAPTIDRWLPRLQPRPSGWSSGSRCSPRPAPTRSTTRPPSCAGSSATCTTARRPGWSRCR